MKKLVSIVAALLVTFQASASENTKFVAVDQTLESNLCVVAAKEGYNAAKDTAKTFSSFNKQEFNAIVCNGKRIFHFAKYYENIKQQSQPIKQVTYRFKILDDTTPSRMCAIAAEQGLDKAVLLGGKEVKQFVCNGKSIAYFARKYQNS
jgi:hypothetical protein